LVAGGTHQHLDAVRAVVSGEVVLDLVAVTYDAEAGRGIAARGVALHGVPLFLDGHAVSQVAGGGVEAEDVVRAENVETIIVVVAGRVVDQRYAIPQTHGNVEPVPVLRGRVVHEQMGVAGDLEAEGAVVGGGVVRQEIEL
jgi:hypothetical protein